MAAIPIPVALLDELLPAVKAMGATAMKLEVKPAKAKRKKRPAAKLERFSPPQVAKRYGVSPDTVRSWIERGELRAVNIGNGTKKPRYRIEPDALADFDKRRTADKTPPQKRPKKKPTGLTVTKFSDR